MATEKTLNARVQCKWDTLENWGKPAAQNLVLKQGEIGFIYVPKDDATQQEAAVLFKVGDGVSKFSALPVGQAAAADVYSWAKASTKPTYTANEISNLDTYISGKVATYQVIQDTTDGHKFMLQTKTPDATSWTTISTITIPDNDTKYTLTTGKTNGTISFNGTDVAVAGLGSAAYTDKPTSYSATLTPAGWTASGSVFKNTYSNTELRASVSPVISCTENAAEYAYITDAEATAKTGIVFTARKKPTANIILTIVDVG